MLHTTNYHNAFISIAEDCPAQTGEVPPLHAGKQTVVRMQYAMLVDGPYVHTSDDVVFALSAVGRALGPCAPKRQVREARTAFFGKGQACMRASPLAKRFGWGIHLDASGRMAIFPVGSDDYGRLASDTSLAQLKAMRSKRA